MGASRATETAVGALRGFCAALALTVGAATAGCGHKAEPLPPIRYEPAPAKDLSVHQQGDALIFGLTYPKTTRAGGPLPGLSALEIWDLPVAVPPEQAQTVDDPTFTHGAARVFELETAELKSMVVGDRIEARVGLPPGTTEASQEPGAPPQTHLFAVKTRSSTGETSLFSNRVALQIRADTPPPRSLGLEPTADGVVVTWQAPEAPPDRPIAGYNVYRRDATARGYGAPLARVEPDQQRYVDATATFGERFLYTVRTLASLDPLVESAAAIEREIDYVDRFAPAPPAMLLALGEREQVRLVITPSPSRDVVGYFLYRRDPGGEFRRLQETPTATLETIDRGLVSGLTYTYRATAIDGVGNEGAPGDEVSVTVP